MINMTSLFSRSTTGHVTVIEPASKIFIYGAGRGRDTYDTSDFPYPVSGACMQPTFLMCWPDRYGGYSYTYAYTTPRLASQINKLLRSERNPVSIAKVYLKKKIQIDHIYNVKPKGLPIVVPLSNMARQLTFNKSYSELVMHMLEASDFRPFTDKQDKYYAIKYFVNRKLRSALEHLL